MLHTQDIPGKGVGVIATWQISVGTLVLSERPIIQVASSTYQASLAHLVLAQLQKLDSHDREGFIALRNTHEQTCLRTYGLYRQRRGKREYCKNLASNAAVHDARTTIPTSSSNPSKAPKLCREALHLLQEEGEIVFSPFRDNLLRRIPSLHLPR